MWTEFKINWCEVNAIHLFLLINDCMTLCDTQFIFVPLLHYSLPLYYTSTCGQSWRTRRKASDFVLGLSWPLASGVLLPAVMPPTVKCLLGLISSALGCDDEESGMRCWSHTYTQSTSVFANWWESFSFKRELAIVKSKNDIVRQM